MLLSALEFKEIRRVLCGCVVVLSSVSDVFDVGFWLT